MSNRVWSEVGLPVLFFYQIFRPNVSLEKRSRISELTGRIGRHKERVSRAQTNQACALPSKERGTEGKMGTTAKKKLVVIHTSMVFVKVETMMSQIFAEVMPDVELINIVDDSLLPDVIKAGAVTPAVERRMKSYLKAAEDTGADAIFSL